MSLTIDHLKQLQHRAEMLASDLRMAKSIALDDFGDQEAPAAFEELEHAEDKCDEARAHITKAIEQLQDQS